MEQIDQALEQKQKLKIAVWHAYSEGANYAMFALAEKLHIESKDIRLSRGSVYDKVDRLAQRIRDTLCPTP